MKRELTLSQVIAIGVVAWLIVVVANMKPQQQEYYKVIAKRNDTLELQDTKSTWQGLAVIKNGRVVRIATEHK